MKAMNVKLSLLLIFLVILFSVNIVHAQGTPPLPPGGGNNFTIRVFLEGFYTGSSTMRQAHELKDDNSIAPRWVSPIAERITVELHTPGQYGQVGSTYAVPGINLLQDGYLSVNLPTEGTYYVTIRTRNHLETVSATEINLATTSSYDFTTAANKAYGSNQVHLGGGVYGLFAGDVNQDGLINISDLNPIVASVRSDNKGYIVEDINGDGLLNISDVNPVVANIRANVVSITP